MKNCGITAVNSKVLVGPIQMHRYVQASKKVKVDMQMPLFVFTGVVVAVAFPLQLLCCRVVVLSWLDVTNNNNSHSIIYALWECKRAFRLLSCLLLLFFLTAHHCISAATFVCINLLLFFGECGKWHRQCFAFMRILFILVMLLPIHLLFRCLESKIRIKFYGKNSVCLYVKIVGIFNSVQ